MRMYTSARPSSRPSLCFVGRCPFEPNRSLTLRRLTGGVIAPLFPSTSLPSTAPRASSLSPLAPLIALRPSPIPEALIPVVDLYEQHLVRAKYGSREPEEEEWDEVVKVVAVLVGVLSGLPQAAGGVTGEGAGEGNS